MTAARWRLLRMWGIQTAAFQAEMAQQNASAGSGAVLAAATFQSLADNSRALALQQRLEATYDRQYNQALAMLLKLRRTPVIHDFQREANIFPEPEMDLTRNE